MKKHYRNLLTTGILSLLLISSCQSTQKDLPNMTEAPLPPPGTTASSNEPLAVVDPAAIYIENFEGWGTALAWGGVIVGGWPDAQRNHIADLLFSLDEGIGLNAVRYNIGGGPNPADKGCGAMRPGGDVPGFMPVDGQWDWNADTNQRWFLQAAKERGTDIFLAFSDSPPACMTISGCTNGAEDGGNNLAPENFGKFADYLATILQHFRDEWGIQFTALAPLNEPNSDWWKKSGRQEGSAFDQESQVALIESVAQSLIDKDLSEVKIAASDTFSVKEAIRNWEYYPETTRAQIGILSTHVYSADPQDQEKLYRLASEAGRPIWMTEFGAGPGPYDLKSMAPAFELAKRITLDLRLMRPTVWIVWDGIESYEENQPHNILWGLIVARYLGDSHEYWPTRQYYAMGNFSKFIRPGAQIIESGDKRTLAAYHPASQQLVLVSRHSDDPEERNLVFDLSLFNGPQAATPYRTSADENLSKLADISILNNLLAVTLKPNSITTFVIQLPSENIQ